MKKTMTRNRKLLLILGLLVLGAALVWAAADIMGLASSLAQDAGSNGGSLEMVSVESIKKPQQTKEYPAGPPCDWALEQRLRSALRANDKQYTAASAKAKQEMASTGSVTAGTRKQVMDLAAEFQSLCTQYANMWDACKCYSRSKLALETGAARMKSAVLVSGDLKKDNLQDMRDAQQKMRQARREYSIKAVEGREISAEDKADIRDRLIPMAKQLMATIEQGKSRATELGWDIKRSLVGGGCNGGGGGGGGSGGSGGNVKMTPEQQLLSSIATVMSSTWGDLLDNVVDLITDLEAIVSGTVLRGISGGACFIKATESK